MSRPRTGGHTPTLRINLVYSTRLAEAIDMLRRGAPHEDVREKHGSVVLKDALEAISKGDQE